MNNEQIEAALAAIINAACPLLDVILATANEPLPINARKSQLLALEKLDAERRQFFEDCKPLVPLMGEKPTIEPDEGVIRHLDMFRHLNAAIPEAVELWRRIISKLENY